MDVITEAARCLVFRRSRAGLTAERFNLHRVAEVATELAYGDDVGHLLPELAEAITAAAFRLGSDGEPAPDALDMDDITQALAASREATAWYHRMIDASNIFWELHGQRFVPEGAHPSLRDPHTVPPAEKAADLADESELVQDYYDRSSVSHLTSS